MKMISTFLICCAFGWLATAAIPNSINVSAEQLLQSAKNKELSLEDRWSSVTKLGRHNTPLVKKELVGMLSSQEWFIKSASLISLQQIDPMLAHQQAMTLLQDPALVVRTQALSALQMQLSQEQRQKLWAELEQSYNFRNKKSLWIRKDILAKLSEKPEKSELHLFTKHLTDKDLGVVAQAIVGLEKLTTYRPKNVSDIKARAKSWVVWVNRQKDTIIE